MYIVFHIQKKDVADIFMAVGWPLLLPITQTNGMHTHVHTHSTQIHLQAHTHTQIAGRGEHYKEGQLIIAHRETSRLIFFSHFFLLPDVAPSMLIEELQTFSPLITRACWCEDAMTGGWNPTLPPTSSCYHFHNSGKNSFFCPPALSDPETLDPAQPFLFQAKEL